MMIIHSAPHLSIYFGDAHDRMYKNEYLDWKDSKLLSRAAIAPVAKRLKLNSLMFLHQVHSTNGYEVTTPITELPFNVDGDFLITREHYVGLGVLAADCLPLVAYDRKHHVSGIAHAGWRGAVAGVMEAMIENMEQVYGTRIEDMSFFFGPSARRCCYEVGPEFVSHLDSCIFTDLVLHSTSEKLFFDLPLFVEQKLLQIGVSADHINRQYNACTICDTRFHSHRRGARMGNALDMARQMTIITLK